MPIVATTGSDGTVKLWDANTGTELTTLNGHTDSVRGVAFSPDGSLLVTTNDDRTTTHYGYVRPTSTCRSASPS